MTIFKFPPILTSVKIVTLIQEGNFKKALKLLSRFYKVSTPKAEIDPDKIYDYYKDSFKQTPAIYVDHEKAIYFKKHWHSRSVSTVLHEFFHHLGNEKGVRHNNETPDDFATHFLRTIEPIQLTNGKNYLKEYLPRYVTLETGTKSKREIEAILETKIFWFDADFAGYNHKTRKWELKQNGRRFIHLACKLYPEFHDIRKSVLDRCQITPSIKILEEFK